jgi:hypothetical protein
MDFPRMSEFTSVVPRINCLIASSNKNCGLSVALDWKEDLRESAILAERDCDAKTT